MTGKYLDPCAASMHCISNCVLPREKCVSEPLWSDHLSACLRQAAVGTDQGEKWCPARKANQPGAVMEKLVRASAASGR